MGTNRGDEPSALRSQQNAKSSNDSQVECLSETPCRQVVQNHPVGAKLEGESKGFPLAESQRRSRDDVGRHPGQRMVPQPGWMCRDRRRDLDNHGRRDPHRFKQLLQESQLPDRRHCDERTGIRDDRHSNGLAFRDLAAQFLAAQLEG